MSNRRDLLKFFTAAPMCLNGLPQAAQAQNVSRIEGATNPDLQWLGIVVGESSIEDCVELATDLAMPKPGAAVKGAHTLDSGSIKLRRPEGHPNSWVLSVSSATVLHCQENIAGLTTKWLEDHLEICRSSRANQNDLAVVCFASEHSPDSDIKAIRQLCDTVLLNYSSCIAVKVLVLDPVCGVTIDTWSSDHAEWGRAWDGIQFNHTANYWMGSRGIWLGRPRSHCALQWFKPNEMGADFADYAHFLETVRRYVTMHACVDEIQNIEAAVRLMVRELKQINLPQSKHLCWSEIYLPLKLMNLEAATHCMSAVNNEIDNAVFSFPTSYYHEAEHPGLIALSISL